MNVKREVLRLRLRINSQRESRVENRESGGMCAAGELCPPLAGVARIAGGKDGWTDKFEPGTLDVCWQ